jgi:hypothetical protein
MKSPAARSTRLVVGFALSLLIITINYRGIALSGLFQDLMTFGLLATFAIFTLLGFARGSSANWPPLFSHTGSGGAWLSMLLVMQIVPYYMTGWESVAKGSEEARNGFDPRNFTRAIYAALVAGFVFYVVIIAVVAYVYPWPEIVSGHVGTEVAFERAFGSQAIARLILFGAFLSLLKVFNGNFVAATRMLYAVGPAPSRPPVTWPRASVVRHARRRRRADGRADAGRIRSGRRHPRADQRGRSAGGGRWVAGDLRRLPRGTARSPERRPIGLGVGRRAGERRDHPDEDRPRRPGELHARRVAFVRGVVRTGAAVLAAPASSGQRQHLIAEGVRRAGRRRARAMSVYP